MEIAPPLVDVERADWEGMGQTRYTREKKTVRERLLLGWERLRLRMRRMTKRTRRRTKAR